jgi:hypothetical protein
MTPQSRRNLLAALGFLALPPSLLARADQVIE